MAVTVEDVGPAIRSRRCEVAGSRPLPHPAVLLLAALAVAWAVTFSVLVVRRHHDFWGVGFDMGIYDQAVWLLAHGHDFITVRGLPVFGHHGTFGLLLFVPAYWMGAGPDFLNVSQVVILALGAVPVYLIARERRLGPWTAGALGAAFLLHPALQFFTAELFHPEAVAITPLLCTYLCSIRKSWGWFAIWAVLAVSFKEDVAIVVAILGLVVAFRGDRKRGFAIAGLAVVWFVLVSQMLIPLVSGHPAHYEGLYSGVGGSPSGMLHTAFGDPGQITARVFSGEAGDFAWKLLAPFGFAPFLAPLLMLMGLPQFLLDVVSDVSWTRTITFHYAALPVAALAVAMIEGTALLRRRLGSTAQLLALGVVMIGAIHGTLAWGPSPIGAEYERGWWPPSVDARLDSKRDAIAHVPADASVSAGYTLVPQLSHRVEIYQFPNPWRSSYWGVADSATPDPQRVNWIVVDRQAMGDDDTALVQSILDHGHFRIVFEADDLLVAHRVEVSGRR